jgi:hypothetical protein
MAARFRVKEHTRIGSRDAPISLREASRGFPVASRLSPAVHLLEITSITPPKWFEPHLSCASDAL